MTVKEKVEQIKEQLLDATPSALLDACDGDEFLASILMLADCSEETRKELFTVEQSPEKRQEFLDEAPMALNMFLQDFSLKEIVANTGMPLNEIVRTLNKLGFAAITQYTEMSIRNIYEAWNTELPDELQQAILWEIRNNYLYMGALKELYFSDDYTAEQLFYVLYRWTVYNESVIDIATAMNMTHAGVSDILHEFGFPVFTDAPTLHLTWRAATEVYIRTRCNEDIGHLTAKCSDTNAKYVQNVASMSNCPPFYTGDMYTRDSYVWYLFLSGKSLGEIQMKAQLPIQCVGSVLSKFRMPIPEDLRSDIDCELLTALTAVAREGELSKDKFMGLVASYPQLNVNMASQIIKEVRQGKDGAKRINYDDMLELLGPDASIFQYASMYRNFYENNKTIVDAAASDHIPLQKAARFLYAVGVDVPLDRGEDAYATMSLWRN